MVDYLWLNGTIRRCEEAAISPLSLGFLVGLGAFETMRWVHPHGVFRLDRHLRRLDRALGALGLPNETSHERLRAAIRETIAANRIAEDVVVRLTIAAGAPDEPPIQLVALRRVSYSSAMYRRGIAARTVPVDRDGTLARHKTLNYTTCWLAKRRALAEGAEEALLIDRDGFLLEGATTNFFLVRRGILHTPSLERALLPGITREAVLEIARARGIPVTEESLAVEAWRDADEAFLTNAVAGVLPLTRIDGEPIGSGTVGERTLELMAAYRTRVHRELVETE